MKQAIANGLTETQLIAILEVTKLDLYSAMIAREEKAKTAIVPASASVLHQIGGAR